MQFITRQVKTHDLGEFLTAVRERLGLTQQEVFLASRVQPKHLAALEEGRFHDLPDPVYVKGYLRDLARLYRQDAAKLLAQFEAERQILENLETPMSPSSPESKPVFIPRFVLSPRVLTFLGFGLLAFASLVYVYLQITSLSKPPKLELLSPEQEGIVDSSLLLLRGHAEPGAQVFLNSQPLVVDAEGNFRESLSLAPGVNRLELRAVSKFGQETVLSRQVIFAEKEIAGDFTAQGAGAGGVNLELSVGPQSAWIYLEADGEVIYAGTMLADSTKRVEAKDRIILTTGNAGSTRVVLNGQALGVLGQEGEVIRNIEFSK